MQHWAEEYLPLFASLVQQYELKKCSKDHVLWEESGFWHMKLIELAQKQCSCECGV